MKKVLAIGLILLMSFQCLYELGVITYFYINREYVAEVLCVNKEEPITMCNGQCFLQKNLDLANDDASDEAALPNGKQKVDFPIFLVSENCITLQTRRISQQKSSNYFAIPLSGYQHEPFHPPTCMS